MGLYLVDNVVSLNRRMIGARRWVSVILLFRGAKIDIAEALTRTAGYSQKVC